MILQALLEGGWKDEEKEEETEEKSEDKDLETTDDLENESSENQLIQSALKSQTVSSSCLIYL